VLEEEEEDFLAQRQGARPRPRVFITKLFNLNNLYYQKVNIVYYNNNLSVLYKYLIIYYLIIKKKTGNKEYRKKYTKTISN